MLLARFGQRLRRRAASGALPLAYIGSSSFTSGALTTPRAIVFPAGTTAGMLALVVVNTNLPTETQTISGGSGGWTETTTQNAFRKQATWYKVLTQADIDAAASSTLTISTSSSATSTVSYTVVYSGVTTASMVSSYTAGNTPVYNLPGWTKTGTEKAFVVLLTHVNNNEDFGVLTNGGASFTKRVEYDPSTSGTGAVFDLLTPASYPSGSAVAVNGTQNAWSSGQVLALS